MIAGAAVVVSNSFVLFHVASNRSSSEAEVTLTSRELPKSHRDPDDTSVELRLDWRGAAFRYGELASSKWLNRAKLEEIGFDCNVPGDAKEAEKHYRHMLSREVFVAVEYDGSAWRAFLDKVRHEPAERSPYRAEPESPETIERTHSRLFAIDAFRDAATLRRRYPDATKVLILRGKIRPLVDSGFRYAARKEQPPILSGSLDLLSEELNVPLPFSRGFPEGQYQVRFRIGMHFEPWLTGIDTPPSP
jgi:hypothetical protein